MNKHGKFEVVYRHHCVFCAREDSMPAGIRIKACKFPKPSATKMPPGTH